MHSKNIPLFFIVASLTSTSLGLHPLAVKARRSFDIILARQTTPSGPCAPVCDSVQSSVQGCSTISCLCTVAIDTEIQACIDCAVAADPSPSIISTAETLIQDFEGACSSVPGLPPLTINTAGAPQSTPIPTPPSTTPVPVTTPNSPTLPPTTPVPVTTTVTPNTTPTLPSTTSVISQVVVGPSSTTSAPNTSATPGVGSTSTSTASNASPNKIILHWTVRVALLGLAAGNLLVL